MKCDYCEIIEQPNHTEILYEDTDLFIIVKDMVITPGQITIVPKASICEHACSCPAIIGISKFPTGLAHIQFASKLTFSLSNTSHIYPAPAVIFFDFLGNRFPFRFFHMSHPF